MKLLLEHQAGVDTRDSFGLTALRHGAKYFRTEILELLLEHDAEVDSRGHMSQTGLHLAASWYSRGHLPTIKLLVRYDTDINAQDFAGCTVLNMAVRSWQVGDNPHMGRCLSQRDAECMIIMQAHRDAFRN